MGTTHHRRAVLRGLAAPTAAVVLLAGLGACGGGDEPDAAAPAPITAAPSTGTPHNG